ncbi:hypothetical protein [Flavobacterium gilvum]|uniref:Uncharacterized protein n=1 Tax=Flavobacterium gilvum TaxID=1492737 RepID=A0AAC9I1B9_9FLAO|nr:hypothetical protein [Flavobacterium gilvum]AOW08134.1 hypothetical protein EM308_00660 [Flavobacterium gilvum]KFC57596.1 hypothetical protein FEM08_36270 [Flavobacterium gilvum]
MKVTFEIKVYENDWKYILYGNYLEKLINNCNHDFFLKQLIINNVNDVNEVLKYAEKKVTDGVIDKIIVVNSHEKIVLKYFNLEKDSFNGGFNYSIAELTGIYFCETDYLFHFSSDSFVNNIGFDWIKKAVENLEKDDRFIVANPTWNNNFEEAKNEAHCEIDDFYVGYGFSDQCYLIKSEVFKSQIYSEKNIDSERYPNYGGELFEKRVDAFMRNINNLRITSKEVSYIHVNFPKKSFLNIFKPYNLYVAKKRLK